MDVTLSGMVYGRSSLRDIDQSGEGFVEQDAVDASVVRVFGNDADRGEGGAATEGVGADDGDAAGDGDGGEGGAALEGRVAAGVGGAAVPGPVGADGGDGVGDGVWAE
jgi:hypothetical protein